MDKELSIINILKYWDSLRSNVTFTKRRGEVVVGKGYTSEEFEKLLRKVQATLDYEYKLLRIARKNIKIVLHQERRGYG